MGEEAGADDQHALVAQRPEPLAERRAAAPGRGWAATSAAPGCRPSGYMIFSGTQAPWSSPRLACWCTGSVSGIIAATRCGQRGGVRGLVGHPVVLRVEAAEVVDQRRAARADSADRRGLPVRADDQDRLRARQVAGPGGELARPHRVVEQRGRAVADVERGHPEVRSCSPSIVEDSTLFRSGSAQSTGSRALLGEQPVDPAERAGAEEATARRERRRVHGLDPRDLPEHRLERLGVAAPQDRGARARPRGDQRL